MRAGAGLAPNARSNRSSALRNSVSSCRIRTRQSGPPLASVSTRLRIRCNPMLSVSGSDDLDNHLSKRLPGDYPIHRIAVRRQLVVVLILQFEAIAIVGDDGSQLLDRSHTMHGKGCIVRP